MGLVSSNLTLSAKSATYVIVHTVRITQHPGCSPCRGEKYHRLGDEHGVLAI
jgi:hypothetical protein